MQPHHTVLIVDDDRLTREHHRDFLKAGGFSVVEAHNGAEALLWLLRETPGLIILDREMPVLDGRSFLEYRLRRAEIWAIPVLVVTSRLDDAEPRQLLLRLGADRLVQKPVTREELLGAVAELFAKPRTPAVSPPLAAREAARLQDTRVAFTFPIRVHKGFSLLAVGRLHDLSAGGLGAYLPRRLPPGETITVSVDIHGRSMILSGVVQWAAEDFTAKGYRHGIRFTERQEDPFPLHVYSFFRKHLEAMD